MHKLLVRQLRMTACQLGEGVDFDSFIAIVDKTYHEFDRGRSLNDRATRLMEEELNEANAQAQREHDAVLATILSSAYDGLLVTRDDGTVDIANAAAELQFGAQTGGLAGHAIGTLMGAEAEEIASHKGSLDDLNWPREASAYTLDGGVLPVEFSVSTLEMAGLPRQLWIVRNISERLRAQREILESRMRFQDFAEASSDCFWEMNESFSHAEAQSPNQETLSACVADLLTPGTDGKAPAGVSVNAWTLLRHNMTARQHFRDLRLSLTRPDDEVLHLSLSGKPVLDLEGHFRGYRGTGRDVTREVTARQAARRAERRLIEAMDGAANAFALVDLHDDFVTGNSALKALAPGAAEYLEPGRPFAAFLACALQGNTPRNEEIAPAELLRTLVTTQEAQEIEVGGTWLLVAARGLSDGGAVITFSDVTALKEREAEFVEAKYAAESANRLKSQFLATMSHELRTPLNAVLGFSEIIRDRAFGHDDKAWIKYTHYASSIYASGRHLLSLISEILDLSKIEAGSYVLDLNELDMREVVDGVVTIISSTAQQAGVQIVQDMPASPLMLSGDERALRQIVLNLISNAVKFTPKGGRVCITLEPAGGGAEFTVQDTGMGIPQEYLQTVFEPFRQVDASIRRRHEGTGLGLAITKRLVEMHGGTIQLESQVGKGTQVRVRLPDGSPKPGILSPDSSPRVVSIGTRAEITH